MILRCIEAIQLQFVGRSFDFALAGRRARPATGFRRGDCNDDGRVNISDAAWILNWLFRGGAEPGCAAAANANGDGEVNLSDPVALLSYLFLAGPAIPAPFPECGTGTLAADDELGCATPPASCGAGP